MHIESTTLMMVKSNNGPQFLPCDSLCGSYDIIAPPDDWRQELQTAAQNSGVEIDVGDPDDWQWFEMIGMDEQGFRTGQDELVAVTKTDSWWFDSEDDCQS